MIDLDGRFVAPGLIDAHVHIESSMVPPAEFARAVVPRGVTTVITDPHEIGNVLGLQGIRFMLREAERAPLDIWVNAAVLRAGHGPRNVGRASGSRRPRGAPRRAAGARPRRGDEFPRRVGGDPGGPRQARRRSALPAPGRPLPRPHRPPSPRLCRGGHPQRSRGDHRPGGAGEATRRAHRLPPRGDQRAQPAARSSPWSPPVTERHLCLCTDDRQPADLLEEGSIDHLIRIAIAEGIDPVIAFRLGTLNTAEHYGLHDRGAVAPGRRADLVIFSDLSAPRAAIVFRGGVEVARNGRLLDDAPRPPAATLPSTVHLDPDRLDFAIPATGGRIRVIGAIPDQLLTENLEMDAAVKDGLALADPQRDLLKMAVVERHHGTGRTGLGFVRGIGLREGAIASTVAHDHHNLVVIGADDDSMRTAARAVAGADGGLAVARGSEVLALLPLPIAGLMSDRPIEEVRDRMLALLEAAHGLGASLRDPFMAMSFLALEVIPSLKLTDVGLVDVERFAVVPLFV